MSAKDSYRDKAERHRFEFDSPKRSFADACSAALDAAAAHLSGILGLGVGTQNHRYFCKTQGPVDSDQIGLDALIRSRSVRDTSLAPLARCDSSLR